jgi:putative drug exporter of the RND superfamily
MTLLGRAAWWLPPWPDRALPDVDIEGAALERHIATPERTAEPVGARS